MSDVPGFERIVQKAEELKRESLSGCLPESAAAWNSLLLSDIADYLPIGITMLNEDFEICRCNRCYEEYISSYSRYRPAEALGMSYFECFPGSRPSIVEILRFVRSEKQQHTSHEFPLMVEQESLQRVSYWDARVVPVRDGKGRVVGIIIFTLDATDRVQARRELHERDIEIRELKTALRKVFELRQEDRSRLETKVLANCEALVQPFLSNLRRHLRDSPRLTCVDGIESGLKELVSDFSLRLGAGPPALSPREVQVAALIRLGKTTKEISESLFVSPSSVDFHRKNIRAKLGLKNKGVNLRTFLESCLDP